MLFNKNGILDIDSIIINNESYKKIIEDHVITEEEISAQSEKVVAILRNMQEKYSKEQLEEIKNLLAESSVLYAIYNVHTIRTLNSL